MQKKMTITAVLAVALIGTAAQAVEQPKTEIPTCDNFMQRLRDAGSVLTVPLPPVNIERNTYVTDIDTFWVSYAYSDITWEGSMSCVDGRFEDYQMSFDDYDLRRSWPLLSPNSLRDGHIVAAAIYAFTGWQVKDN